MPRVGQKSACGPRATVQSWVSLATLESKNGSDGDDDGSVGTSRNRDTSKAKTCRYKTISGSVSGTRPSNHSLPVFGKATQRRLKGSSDLEHLSARPSGVCHLPCDYVLQRNTEFKIRWWDQDAGRVQEDDQLRPFEPGWGSNLDLSVFDMWSKAACPRPPPCNNASIRLERARG